MSSILDLSLKQIAFAETAEGVLNPRGQVNDTTDLQYSMGIAGQREPISVIAVADERYHVVDGHRRVVAARALGWKSIRAEVVEVKDGEDNLLAAMLASNVRQDFKPSALGRAVAKLALSNTWGIERVAKLCGLRVDRAQLLVDLTAAPESVQRRVDRGEMSLSAWKVLRDKPRPVQEQAARLDKPTVANCRQTIHEAREQAPAGVFADMLDQMNGEHALVAVLNEVRSNLLVEWHRLTTGERTRARSVIGAMAAFVEEYAEVEIGA